MESHFILYVADQPRSTHFYAGVLGVAPRLEVPGMTEFALPGGGVLGLMPEAGIKALLGTAIADPAAAGGAPRCELYLLVDDPAAFHARALAAGGREVSALAPRDWGHRAAYSLDPDGHVLAFAQAAAACESACRRPAASERAPRRGSSGSNRMQSNQLLQNVAALVAVGFGLATIFAGSRVLLGADPGYVVFRPLLIYNTAMGFVYLAAGIVVWRSFVRGRSAAGAIFVLNLVVLAAIGALYANGGAVALESVHAMVLRTVVWFLLFAVCAWLVRSSRVRE